MIDEVGWVLPLRPYLLILQFVKEKLVPLLVVLGVAWAAFGFDKTVSTAYDAIDGLRDGLNEVAAATPAGSNISFQFIGDPARRDHALAYARYILAPRYLSPDERECDTVLTMCNENVYGKVQAAIEGNRRVLAKTRSKNFYFVATCSR